MDISRSHRIERGRATLPVHEEHYVCEDSYDGVSTLKYPARWQTTLPVIVHNWATRTNLSHRGRAVASLSLRLYFFSKRSCCCDVIFLMSGGHTFLSLYVGLVPTAFSRGLVACANRRTSVGNMAGVNSE
jgi:hypothetical protein